MWLFHFMLQCFSENCNSANTIGQSVHLPVCRQIVYSPVLISIIVPKPELCAADTLSCASELGAILLTCAIDAQLNPRL